jgi:aryl-alcohol dehydrogenase-like predicted oxidoreductase
MQQRNIGSLCVSAVGLGCNNFGMRIDAEQTRRVVDAALHAGINHFDTADIYGGTKSEEYLGQALGLRRKEVVLATKFGMEVDAEHKGARPEYVHSACAASLRRLGTDWIDLYWLHTPDDTVPISETLGALHELVTAGKVRQIGCSNFTASQLREAADEAQRLSATPFVAVQNEYSLVMRQPETDGVLAECQAQGLVFVPFFPLASGLLSGKYRAGQAPPEGSRLAASARAGRFLNDTNLALVEKLITWLEARATAQRREGLERPDPMPADVAEAIPSVVDVATPERAWTLLDCAIAWLLAQPQVASVIAGATTAEQVRANAAAAEWRMSAADKAAVDGVLESLG